MAHNATRAAVLVFLLNHRRCHHGLHIAVIFGQSSKLSIVDNSIRPTVPELLCWHELLSHRAITRPEKTLTTNSQLLQNIIQ
jgi:hypothetical protein